MQFSPKNLGDRFKDLIDWMMRGGFGQEIMGSLQTYQQQRAQLESDPDADSALRSLLYTKATNGLAREMPCSRKAQFDSEVDSFLVKHKGNLRTEGATADLAALVQRYSVFRITQGKADEWVRKVFGYSTLMTFTKDQHTSRKNGKKALLGDKGTDHYLRDLGFFDRAPVDRHERRFLIRTGIFHAFTTKGRQDPLEYDCLHDALTTFSLFCLQGKRVAAIDLGSAPGLVDLFIWFFCAEGKYDICGKTPKCVECRLNDACLYSLANIQSAIARGQTMQEYGLAHAVVNRLLHQIERPRPLAIGRNDWAKIRLWAQKDPDGLALSLRQFGMDRSAAREFLKRAGLTPGQINGYYP
jgi:hypothetical protein